MSKRKMSRGVEKAREARRRKRRLKAQAISFGKDILVAVIIVLIVMGSLYAYSGGIWPPMVVVESESMMHGSDSQIGIIDTGDLTLVKKIYSRHDVVTYVEGRGTFNASYTEYLSTGAHAASGVFHGTKSGFKTYGDYGDVIVYRKNGLKPETETPIIHRAMVWFVANTTSECQKRLPMSWVGAGDYPDIKDSAHPDGLKCVGELAINDVGYMHERLTISSNEMVAHEINLGLEPYAGYLTKGDHNQGGYVDQRTHSTQTTNQPLAPNKVSWVVGKAVGELPWFGALKLVASNPDYKSKIPESSWKGLIMTIALIIIVPFLVDIAIAQYAKKRAKAKGKKDDDEEDEEEQDEDDKEDEEKDKEKDPDEEEESIKDVDMDDEYSDEFKDMAASKPEPQPKRKRR